MEIDHRLKTWPGPYNAVMDGTKTHEVRKNDRGFKVGDKLLLEEWLPDHNYYSGRSVVVEVTYITDAGSFGLPENVCVLSIKKINVVCY